jgi:DNA-binding transcriptional ArsR family regulator
MAKWVTSGINRRCGQSGDVVNTTRISFPICPVSRLGRECAHSPFTSAVTPPRKERLGVRVAGPMQLALDLALHAADPRYILNPMVQFQRAHLDASFGTLSDATRRGVLEQLGRADASITALAERFHMTLTGMKKHVGVLEQAGLVSTEKVGRVRTCKLGRRGLEQEAAWIERYRQLWAARFDKLDIVVEELKRKEKANGRKKRK